MEAAHIAGQPGPLFDVGKAPRPGVGLDTTAVISLSPLHAEAPEPPPPHVVPPLRSLAPEPCDELIIGGTRLRVEACLGTGATAAVYRGVDIDLHHEVAIKVLRGVPDEVTRLRFLEEARFAARVQSPYVASATQVGTLPDGRPYYVMGLARGSTIATLVREGPLPTERVVAILRMACKGLAAAHTQGIVHRDIKPANMVLERLPGHDRLVLVDFGIAGRTGRRCQGMWGTPRYMPPEQIRGDRLDARADIYALGCCAYEMLTGRPLFDGESTQDVLLRHLDASPPVFDTGQAARVVPEALARVVRECVAVDPDDRPSSAVELEARLCEAQIAAGLPSSPGGLEPPDVEPTRLHAIVARLTRVDTAPARRTTRTRRALLLAAALALATVAATGVGDASAARSAAAAAADRGSLGTIGLSL